MVIRRVASLERDNIHFFSILVHMKSGQIRGMAFSERGLKRGELLYYLSSYLLVFLIFCTFFEIALVNLIAQGIFSNIGLSFRYHTFIHIKPKL